MIIKRVLNLKILLYLFLTGVIVGSIWYYNLSNRHKAIVKTKIIHTLRLVDHEWDIVYNDNLLQMQSPDLLIDNIYQSMDGPQALININVNPEGNGIKWITGFKVEVFREGTIKHNNDLLCHTNIDFFDAIHYRNLNLIKRINLQYPRFGTLSNGINELNFPKGFGFPIAENEKFIVASRTLNHNIEDAFFKVKHHIEFKMADKGKHLKPLTPKALVLLQDYDRENPFSPDTKQNPNLCVPIDLKNHSFSSDKGIKLSSHWVLPKGKYHYEFNITYQLNLKEDSRIHAMAAHLHPNAESLTLYDITLCEAIHTFHCENYPDRIGLKNVPVYSSEVGIQLKADHQYKLILETYNPYSGFRDMMVVLFLYLYDREMDEHLNNSNLSGLDI